jgi:UDP-N-acetylmuramate dehydrogenase
MKPQSDVTLAPLTTLGVGGPARWFLDARTESEICAALGWAQSRGVEVHVLGGGSNVVIADAGLDALVLRVGINGVDVAAGDGVVVNSAGAGEEWDAFVAATVKGNLAGLECLSGIPGRVGGTPVQNVGAYGQDVSGTIVRVRAVDRATHRSEVFSNEECGFAYRTSRFKHVDANRFVVSRVDFALRPDAPPTMAYADVVSYFEARGEATPSLASVRDAILEIRRRKGMVIEDANPARRSCGSFFVNPVVSRSHFARVAAAAGETVPHYEVGADQIKIPAAWLIERAGFPKGTSRGVVGISPFQAQAIVNHGGAAADDVFELACDVKQAVWETFRVAILPEPVFLGFQLSPRLSWLLTPPGPS